MPQPDLTGFELIARGGCDGNFPNIVFTVEGIWEQANREAIVPGLYGK